MWDNDWARGYEAGRRAGLLEREAEIAAQIKTVYCRERLHGNDCHHEPCMTAARILDMAKKGNA